MATKKRITKFDKQYLLSGDEMKALVDFMREVAGLEMSPTTEAPGAWERLLYSRHR